MLDVELCMQIAKEAHKGQIRRGGDNYFDHPKRVADMLNSPTLKCMALLHDVLEDTDETEKSLRAKGVSDYVVQGVSLLTKRDNQSYDEYIESITLYPQLVRVKIADMFDNLCCDPSQKQKQKYREAMIKLYEHC